MVCVKTLQDTGVTEKPKTTDNSYMKPEDEVSEYLKFMRSVQTCRQIQLECERVHM
jgi:hypothetical protein